ncbi:11886_t:CDS:2 [Gigaspora margarita]|uniref:11886_t:CDS:1 n=1 Tax=Gigaspora margarita TaxID=4874 RepID=A0ABN7VL49_GIGMA|nr:11886_t:CDS:2 [Gigaspora margarita]
MELHKWIGYKKASNKEITKKEQYFFNTIETEEDKTKKSNQNILLATECSTRDYRIEELENQIKNSKSEKEPLNLNNHNQELTIDEPRSKNATSRPSLITEEEFTKGTPSFNKNKIKCTIWDTPNETSAVRIRKSLSFYGRTTIQSTMANGKSKAIKLNKQKGLESSGKENRPVVSCSHKNTNNGNFSSESIYYRELAGSSKASRSARHGSWSRGKSNNNRQLLFRYDQMTKKKWEEYSRDLERYLKNRPSINLLHESNLEELCESIDTTKLDRIWDSFEKGILYAAKKNIPYKKLKEGGPNNIRSNKFDKNSASAILKKDVIFLSRIYKLLKCQYKTTKVANLPENVVADFNHQVREINEKYGLEIRISSDFLAEDSLAEIKGW